MKELNKETSDFYKTIYSKKELNAIEKKYNIIIPKQFKFYLLNISSTIYDTKITFEQDPEYLYKPVPLDKPCPLSGKTFFLHETPESECLDPDTDYDPTNPDNLLHGTLVIDYNGCGMDTRLIITGKMAGHVINVDFCNADRIGFDYGDFFDYLEWKKEKELQNVNTISERAESDNTLSDDESSSEREYNWGDNYTLSDDESSSEPQLSKKLQEYNWNNTTLADLLSEYTPNGWEELFDTAKETFPKISQKLEEYAKEHTIFPPMGLTFNIFDQLKPKDVKVVILSQDPYIRTGEAVGMSFSVPPDVKLPPSLRNIYKELVTEGYQSYTNRKSGDLTEWVKKGVFLYNCCLTVNEGKSASHKDLWKDFTNQTISYLNSLDNIAWILLGKKAQQYTSSIDTDRHGVFIAGHPSPLNRLGDFTGSNVFIDAENYLNKHNRDFSWDLST